MNANYNIILIIVSLFVLVIFSYGIIKTTKKGMADLKKHKHEHESHPTT